MRARKRRESEGALEQWEWLQTRTFHHSRYADAAALAGRKRALGMRVSVCLPARNEEVTVGRIVETLRRELVEGTPLIDELVVIDSFSTDDTARVAAAAGATVLRHDELLPEHPPIRGKGDALWRSLSVLGGDIVCWLDADIRNIHQRFVIGLVGPLLEIPELVYVKAFYLRPLREGSRRRPTGGGRVTEILARPMIGEFFPELAGFVQPLSGEYAGRRDALRAVPFRTGYGVELGLLVSLAERFGVNALAQTDLEVREHRNQALPALSRMAAGILHAGLELAERRGAIELRDGRNPLLLQFERRWGEYFLEPVAIEERERPPVASLPASTPA